jgi:hypothetical protein
MRSQVLLPALMLAGVSVALVSCGGGGGNHEQPPVVSITLSPRTVSVTAGQTQQFTATVTGSTNTAVSYALSGSGCTGSACGTISASGLYTAPSPIPASGTVTVTATASADSSKSATATVTHVPVAVAISPATQTLRGADTQQFTATVTGYSDLSVAWTVTGGGTVSDGGLYTAPYAVPSQTTATITATSKFDSTKSASATVTLTPLTIAVTPSTSTLYRDKTAKFTATVSNHSNYAVTWSVSGNGIIDADGLYRAPNVIAAQETATITATSQADQSKSASSTITLLPLTITVSPLSGILYLGQQMQFASAVTQSDDTEVTWALSGANCSGSSCGSIDKNGLYTAPSTLTPVAVTKRIPGSAGPWAYDKSLNAAMPFGAAPGTPVVFNAADGLTVIPGSKITVAYVEGLWCLTTYVSQSTCRDANGWPEYPTTDKAGGAYGTYPPSKYMDPSTYPVATMYLSGAFADSTGAVIGKPFPVGNGPKSFVVPDGATQLQLGSNDCDYITARDFFTPLQARVSQSLVAVTVTATSTIDTTKKATATVTVTDDPNAKLSGPYSFLFQGPGSATGMNGMLGHFVADGGGKIRGEVDSNANIGQPSIKTLFTGIYEIGVDDRGVLTFDSLPGSPSFRFAVGDMQDKEYAVEIDSLNAHLAGYLRRQHLVNVSTSALAGEFAFGFYGAETSGEYIAAVGRMSLDQSGVISAGLMDSTSTPENTFSGTMQLDSGIDSGRATLSLVVPNVGTIHGTIYAVNPNRLLFMIRDQVGMDVPLLMGELQRQTGTFSSASINGPAVFYYTGVTPSNSTASIVGMLAPGGPGLSGEFDSSNNGSVLAKQALTATGTVDESGRAVLNTSVLGQMILYLVDNSRGYLLHTQSQGLGMWEKQSLPAEGLTLGNLQGHKTCANTQLPYPNSGAFSCTMTWDPNGSWDSVTDSTSLRYQNHVGMIDNGQITLEPATGRFTNIMLSSPFHHVGYVIAPGKLALICSDPVSNNEGVLWQSVGYWER